MIIEEKITVRLDKLQKVNENIIYVADVEVEIIKLKILKTKKVKEVRHEKIVDILFEKNPSEANKIYFENLLKFKCSVTEFEKLEIKKITLKKELSCSFYKR